MSQFSITATTRPNRIEDIKNEDYHAKFARWASASSYSAPHQAYIYNCERNLSFYKGNSWINQEDNELFFMDESGSPNNRIKLVENICQPMVEFYKGSAIRMNFTARADSVDPFVITKKERERGKRQNLSRLAAEDNVFSQSISDQFPIGKDPAETDRIFENSYVEEYAETINALIRVLENQTDIDYIKERLAFYLPICGIGIILPGPQNMEFTTEVIHPLNFLFDRSAQRRDLGDAAYMGHYIRAGVSSILEHYEGISSTNSERLEKWSVSQGHGGMSGTSYASGYQDGAKPMVFKMKWLDSQTEEYGFVQTEHGVLSFERINGNTRFKDSDLVQIDESTVSEELKKKLKGRKKIKIRSEVWRYCDFIPGEEVGATGGGDIVLDWGINPYDRKDHYSPHQQTTPYVVDCWEYDRGEIISPMDAVIDPQRRINRLTSIADYRSNDSGGISTFYSTDGIMVDEATMVTDIKKGAPIAMKNTIKNGGVQNMVVTKDNTTDHLAVNAYQQIALIQRGVENTTGVNEALTGNQGEKGTLVGVVDAQIAQGSLLQEPMFDRIGNILGGWYDRAANQAPLIYLDNPRVLVDFTGPGGAALIKINKDVAHSSYRIFMHRTPGETDQKNAGNQVLFQLLQFDLIGEEQVANLLGRATPEMAFAGARQYIKERSEARRIAQEKQGRAEDAAAQQNQALAERTYQDDRGDKRREHLLQYKELQDAAEKPGKQGDESIRKINAQAAVGI